MEVLHADGRVGAEDRWVERKQHLVARTGGQAIGGDADRCTNARARASEGGERGALERNLTCKKRGLFQSLKKSKSASLFTAPYLGSELSRRSTHSGDLKLRGVYFHLRRIWERG